MQSAFKSSVFNKVVLAIVQALHVETPGLSHSTRLVDDLALTRLGRMKLAMSLEDIFDVELEDVVIERFVDLGDVVSYLSHRYFKDTEPSTLTIAT